MTPTPSFKAPGSASSAPIKPSRLKTGLLALLFAVQAVTIVGVLASERSHTEQTMRANADALMQQLVVRASDSTQRYLAPAARAAEFTRTQLQQGQLDLGNDDALRADFLNVLCSTPEVENIFVGRTDGSFMLVGRRPGGRFRTKQISVGSGQRRVWLGETTCRGETLAGHPDTSDRYDPRTRGWYRKAATGTSLVWTDPYVFFTQQIPGVTSAVSLYGTGGRLRGVIGTDVALSSLTDFLTQVPFSAHGAALIGTTAGLAIASPGIGALVRNNPKALPYLDELGGPVRQMFALYGRGQAGGQTGGLQTFTLAGTPYYSQMMPLNIGHGTKWLIGVHAPASDFNGTVRQQYLKMQLTALGIGLLGFLLALPLLLRLQAPFRRLALLGMQFQQSHHFNALLSREGVLMELNDAALQASGLPSRELIGRPLWSLPWWQHMNTLDSAFDAAALERAIGRAGGGEYVRFAIGMRWNDRPPIDVDLSLKPVLGRDGRVMYVVAEGRDITEEQRQSRALREREERLHTVMNALDEGVMVQDAEGRVLSLNVSGEQILGMKAGEVQGFRLTDFDWSVIDTEGQPFPIALLPGRAALESGQAQPNTVFGVVRAGRPVVWLSLNCSPLIRHDETVPYAVVSSFSDITLRRQAEQSLAHQARHDALTGLPNRTLFQDRLREILSSGHPGAVAFLDLDHFKAINDSLGHDVGDQLLRALAQRLTGLLRPSDTVARMGGDEFTIILSEVSTPELAGEIARKILGALEEPFVLGGHELRASVSLGLALFPHDGRDAETLLKHADTAMYHAKTSGKNAYRVYRPQMSDHHSIKARQYQHTELQRALERQEFVLHYQPIYSMTSGEITGMEALLRWQHPERGLLLPSQFLPALETSGLIHPAGTWVLRQACLEAARIQRLSGRALHVAVNVSPLQFEHEGFEREVQDALSFAGLAAPHLELEMTEGLVMNDPEAVVQRMRQLRRLGVRLAIDDFGTGYSNLSVLRHLPLNILKIDRAFVQEAETDATVVQAIISLARNLQLEVVAEGVETEGQLRLLLGLGCDRLQGYYASRATPADELAGLLTAPPLQVGLPLPRPLHSGCD